MKPKTEFMTQRQKKRQVQTVQDFLGALVIDFMHFVKSQPEEDKEADKKVSERFKVLSAKWKAKCHEKEYLWMKLHLSAFANNVERLSREAENIVGVKPATGKIISLNEK